MKNKNKTRYLVILDEYGQIEDIIYDINKIFKYLKSEYTSEANKGRDKEDSREV